MYKRMSLFLITVVFIFGVSKISYAMSCHEDAGNDANIQTTQLVSSEQSAIVHPGFVSQKAVNVGNKICPVTGEKIDEKTKVTYE